MRSDPILVLGSYKERKLNDALARAGYVPIVRRTIDAALQKIRHGYYAGIVVERNWVDVDVLEFVLNVRDYDQSTRIIVVGESQNVDSDDVLKSMQRTFNVGQVSSADHLTSELESILGNTTDP